ncbi:molybdate ABC transporter substrate-binding protein [Motilimonas sp. KMU-193]|uniref:molybdate ABC transporter substrate-binding protein n=1 Tax=Motilimonas sp. KMU-193 TaxID=3388668 RepID=UPI00396B3789
MLIKQLTKQMAKVMLLLIFAAFSVQAEPLKVLVAASLQPAMTQLISLYQQANPKQEIALIVGASSALARQIAQGAPADIYVSANQRWLDYLNQNTARVQQQASLVGNELVLVSKKAHPNFNITQLSDWQSALAGQRLVLADPQHVPAGIYAQQGLTSLGLWQDLNQQVAYGKHVRASLALVERGAAPLGIVYASDAYSSDLVEQVAIFPAESHEAIVYPAARLSNAPEAVMFYQYLWSDQAKATWQAFGFSEPAKQ